MDQNIAILLKQQWQNLPEELRRAVLDTSLKQNISNVAKKYSLDEEKEGGLLLETILVLIGLEYTKDYLRNIKEKCGLDDQTTRSVGNEINEVIFKSIGDSLKKLNAELETVDSAGTLEQEKPTPIPIRTPQKPSIPRQGLGMPETPAPPANLPTMPPVLEPAIPKDVEPQPKYGIAPGMLGKEDDMEIIPVDPSTDLVTNKLTSVVKLPKEQKFVNSAEKPKTEPYKGSDPYREPLG